MPVESFGKLFEEMRSGVDQATLVAPDSSAAKPGSVNDDDIGSKCAQVSAAWTLASELKVDQPDLTFVGLQEKEWIGPNLGCTESSEGNQEKTPGFEVEFLYSGSNYLVRSNQYGSVVKIC
jgi:hypothetical protein